MNTELRERAEAILNNYRDDSKYPNINEVVISKNDAIDFALDFHKQELQRIGEVYVPESVKKGLPTDDEYYFVEAEWNDREVKQIGRYDSNERGWTCETKNTKPTHWLKKLSLSNVGENNVTGDNKNGIDCCDAPFKDTNSI